MVITMKFVVAFLAVCSATQAFVPRPDHKIVGGEQVAINDFPYQVSVRMYDTHLCGGSIINAETILSAAHCIIGTDSRPYGVRVGNADHSEGEYFQVARMIPTSNFNPKTLDKDMAIFKLERPISFSAEAQPIQLQPKGLEVPVGSTAWVSGWGITYEGSQTIPSLLRATDLTIISPQRCSDIFKEYITAHMFCAHTLDQDSCQGDSGGPLVSDGKLIGVVSWGFGCARPEYPGVYAKVSSMFDWIVENSN